MIIDCISDLHGNYPELHGGDLLIVAGDLTATHTMQECVSFFLWLQKQNYHKKIIIGGNHDTFLPDKSFEFEKKTSDIEYLCDSQTEFEGLKIWGSPWTSQFRGMNPKCKAFTVPSGCDSEDNLDEKWSEIPKDVDILITHCPPFGILDGMPMEDGSHFHVGSVALRNRILKNEFKNLKLHVFGHIHECGGKMVDLVLAKFVNASIVNERYRHVNKPVRIEI